MASFDLNSCEKITVTIDTKKKTLLKYILKFHVRGFVLDVDLSCVWVDMK